MMDTFGIKRLLQQVFFSYMGLESRQMMEKRVFLKPYTNLHENWPLLQKFEKK